MPVRISLKGVPFEEYDAVDSIQSNFSTLESLARGFRETVDLYLFTNACSKKFQAEVDSYWHENSGWYQIAARNGAISAYSFLRVLEAVNSAPCPTVWSMIDTSSKKIATKIFASEFPKVSGTRQSTAHPGEFTKSKKERQRHSLNNNGSELYISGMMQTSDNGMIVSSTFEGKMVDYELSLRKADVLDAVIKHYESAFIPLEEESDVIFRAFSAERETQRLRDQRNRPPWWSGLLCTENGGNVDSEG